MKANNNTLASADSTTYESNNSTSYTYNSSAAYTLLIDGYDADASYSHKTGSYNPTSDGALLATLGYKSRSTSYYLQLGGVINNAAANFRASADGMLMMVWQFHTGSYGFDKKYWTYSANSILASAYYPSSASGWTYTLLTIGEGTGSNSSGYSGSFPGASFGTSTFPTVITTSQAAKDALVKNSQRENGLYTPYDIVTDGSLNYFGVNTGSILLFSCIGANGIDSTVNAFADYDGINEDAVYVNPCGLFSCWTEGAGMEAVLECAWANDVINSDSEEVGYWDYVEEFYETFYRYSLTKADKTDILDGE